MPPFPDNTIKTLPAASVALMAIIQEAKKDASRLFGSSTGQFFVGESGTERVSKYQNLRCKFDFEMVKATFEEVKYGTS